MPKICQILLFCVLSSVTMAEDSARESFDRAWKKFESACVAGDAQAIQAMCSGRIVSWLDDKPLADFLAVGWKVDALKVERRVISVPFKRHAAGVFLILDVTEFGDSHLSSMWWILVDSEWKCLNLPFEHTILPSEEVKWPPISDEEPNQPPQTTPVSAPR